jgi:dolichyl-phosphate-mannose-protein mannosyltransferase
MSARRFVVPALLVLAAVPRLVGLGHPEQLMFDEAHYARDACTYVSSDGCGIDHEVNDQHPPGGKWLIATGIVVFGNNSFGWRIVPALAGIASVLLLYLLGLQVSGSVRVAALAAALLAVDPLHFVQSRIAMLDIFVVAFGLACLLCAYKSRSGGSAWWVAAVGLTGGAAIACKWSGAVFLVIALAMMARAGERKRLVLPVALMLFVYCLSFVGRVDGVGEFFTRQADMWSFHSGLDYQHPYASPAWSWLLLQRPVAYFFGTLADGRYAEVLATGNPFIWLPASLGVGHCAIAVWKQGATPLERFALVGSAGAFGIWLVMAPFRSAMFLFYMTAALPFMYLALAAAVARVRWAQLAAGVTAVAFFLFMWPLMTAQPIGRDGWHARILFEDCEAPGRTPEEIATPLVNATPGGGRAPTGWCWI